MLEYKTIFQERVLNRRGVERDRLRQEREQTINSIIQSRKVERDTKRKIIYFLRTEEERQRRLHEEEEARKLEEMERRKKEEAERKAKLDEIAEKQRQRERELEEKERQRREEILGRSAVVPPKADVTALRPAEAQPAAAPAAAAAASTGKYVPRFKRMAAAEVGQAPPPADTDRWSSGSRMDGGDRWRDDRKPVGTRPWQSSREQERRR